jgi:hypothetical protein
MTKASAIYQFWGTFLTAYEENTVPEDATFPYITYQLVTDSFNNDVQLTASVWYRGESWLQANAKVEEISKAIGRGGVFLDCDGGKIWLKRGTPFAQNMGDDTDNLIKRKYLNITAEFLTAD